jgi:hypothetical protein
VGHPWEHDSFAERHESEEEHQAHDSSSEEDELTFVDGSEDDELTLADCSELTEDDGLTVIEDSHMSDDGDNDPYEDYANFAGDDPIRRFLSDSDLTYTQLWECPERSELLVEIPDTGRHPRQNVGAYTINRRNRVTERDNAYINDPPRVARYLPDREQIRDEAAQHISTFSMEDDNKSVSYNRGTRFVRFRARPLGLPRTTMQRKEGLPTSLLGDYQLFKNEKLFIAPGKMFDVDKFRVFITLNKDQTYRGGDNNILANIILEKDNWGGLFGQLAQIELWAHQKYPKTDETAKAPFPADGNLDFSPNDCMRAMQCICRNPFEVWIHKDYGIPFIRTMTKYGWPMLHYKKRFTTHVLIDPSSCRKNPPPISTVFKALGEIQVGHIMMKKHGMRWTVTGTGSPVLVFFRGLEQIRSEIHAMGGRVDLTHIDIAQEMTVNTSPTNSTEAQGSHSSENVSTDTPTGSQGQNKYLPNDVRIPRWHYNQESKSRVAKNLYSTTFRKKRGSRPGTGTIVHKYPQFNGLTGIRDGGVTIENPYCYRSTNGNGMFKLTCYLGTIYHAMRERNGGMPNLNSYQNLFLKDWTSRKAKQHCHDLMKDLYKLTSLLLNVSVPFNMRSEAKFRFSYSEKDENSDLRLQFGLPHFIAVCNDIDSIRDAWQIEMSQTPVYLSGAVHAVMLNVGQMLREVSNRLTMTVDQLMPGNMFWYFRYLNTNALCNLGFTGSRVEQFKNKYLNLDEEERPDPDGIAYLYYIQKRRKENYQRDCHLAELMTEDERMKKYRATGLPKHVVDLLDPYGLPTPAGIDLLLVKKAKLYTDDVDQIARNRSKEEREKIFRNFVIKYWRQRKHMTLEYRHASYKAMQITVDASNENDCPVLGPPMASRQFLDRVDPTNGFGIPKDNGIGIEPYALHPVITPRIFGIGATINSNIRVNNVVYERWLKHMKESEHVNVTQPMTEDAALAFDRFFQSESIKEREGEDGNDEISLIDVAPSRGYNEWLRREPVSYRKDIRESNIELTRLILSKGTDYTSIPLPSNTVEYLKNNLNFCANRDTMRAVLREMLRFHVTRRATKVKMLDDLASTYGYTFKEESAHVITREERTLSDVSLDNSLEADDEEDGNDDEDDESNSEKNANDDEPKIIDDSCSKVSSVRVGRPISLRRLQMIHQRKDRRSSENSCQPQAIRRTTSIRRFDISTHPSPTGINPSDASSYSKTSKSSASSKAGMKERHGLSSGRKLSRLRFYDQGTMSNSPSSIPPTSQVKPTALLRKFDIDTKSKPPLDMNFSDDSTKADTNSQESPLSILRGHGFHNQPRGNRSSGSISSTSAAKRIAIYRKTRFDTDTDSSTPVKQSCTMNRTLQPANEKNSLKLPDPCKSNNSSIKSGRRKRRKLIRTMGRNPYWTSEASVTSDPTNQLRSPPKVNKTVITIDSDSTTE